MVINSDWSRYHGPKYMLPHRFPPHVTLLGGMDMTRQQAEDTAARIAGKLGPYTLKFQEAGHGTFFFQCVFLRMVQVSHEGETARRGSARQGEAEAAAAACCLSLLFILCHPFHANHAFCALHSLQIYLDSMP